MKNGDILRRDTTIRGIIVVRKKSFLDLNDLTSSVFDHADELLGRRISFQLVGSVHGGEDAENESRGKLSTAVDLEGWNSSATLAADSQDDTYIVAFDCDKNVGIPVAFIVKNFHHNEFYLKSVTLESSLTSPRIHFVCHSWIYPAKHYKRDRVFFANRTYLPCQTPPTLIKYREEELLSLRGTGEEDTELKEWHRVYDYALYNDLGDPDKGEDYVRPVLGGSAEYPYPRRGRTGRAPSKTDPRTESRLPLLKGVNIYVPADERFSPRKLAVVVAYLGEAISHILGSASEVLDSTPIEFDSFTDILALYGGRPDLGKTTPSVLHKIFGSIRSELVKEIVRPDGASFFDFPTPHVIREDKSAWRSDEEFARETLAGPNPLIIRRLQEFPPASKLDRKKYGDQTSSMRKEDVEKCLSDLGLSLDDAINTNRLFIVDHHDVIIPFLRKINATATKTYATRTLLLLKDDGTLMPVAIELSLPHAEGERYGVVSRVYIPASAGIEGSLWQLAKTYAAVNDTGYHQLVSHWLYTHSVMEPFVLATHRRLSVLHPVYKLLHPHFKDTMNLNALARHILINAGGPLETTVFPVKYSMQMTSEAYRGWTFPSQALPNDLIKRGMAVKDSTAPNGIRLLIEDYPYAVDGLDIWSAIENWVRDYSSFYYKSDDMVRQDVELQAWWKEIRTEGHGDKKDKPWWPEMNTLVELVSSCTIIIWVASALHAAVNFGQYPYGGFPPNRPSLSRRLIPEPGSPEYQELEAGPEKYLLKTLPNLVQSVLGITTIEALSKHTADEVYLGERESPEWTSDVEPLSAWSVFRGKLQEIERKITERNNDRRLKNRAGPVKVPYNLLFPRSGPGLTAKGIPNSVSI